MKKFVLIVFALFFTSIVNAGQFDISYKDSDKYEHLEIKNKLGFAADLTQLHSSLNDVQVSTKQYYKSNNKGVRKQLSVNASKQLDEKTNVFLDVYWLNDTIVDSFFADLKIGAGYEVYNNYTHRFKPSLALVLRSDKTLLSIRGKYTYQSTFVRGKLVYTWVPSDSESMLADLDFNLLNNTYIFYNHRYYKNLNSDKETYSKNIGLRIDY